MSGRLYRVLKPGIVQRIGTGDEFRRPAVGDLINISDEGAALAVEGGFVELAEGAPPEPEPAEPTEAAEAPRPRTRARKGKGEA